MATGHPLSLSIRIRSPASDAASGYASNVCRRDIDIPQFHTDGQDDRESNVREHTPVGSVHPAHSATVPWCLLLLFGNLRHERLGREQERGDRRRVLKCGPHHLGRVDDAGDDQALVLFVQRVETFLGSDLLDLRGDQPVVINTVAGAMAIQKAFEMHEWGQQSAQTSQTWAAYLQAQPLDGLSPKPVVVIFGHSDQNAVNPGTSALLRAGNLISNTIYYRHDLACAEDPMVPKNPHDACISPLDPNWTFRTVSLGLQEAIATFFASDGQVFAHPEPARFFEVPIAGPLPELLNYIQ
jgi:hypothetical protein